MLGGADNPNGELPSYITGANSVYGSADEVRTAARQSGILCDSIEIFQKDA
ncbi:hypothetical protein RUM85_004837 [Escherichia coli]|nr:hypothetical protein [Escherichia coli]